MYRKFDKDVVFSGYNVPKGTVVFADFYITGRNPNYFEEPEKFKPERWLKKGEGHPYGSLPFSFGPRMCLGRRVAELELWVLMIKVSLKLREKHEKACASLRAAFIDGRYSVSILAR